MSEPSTIVIHRDRPLGPLTTWRIGGPAAFYAEPTTAEEVAEALRFAIARDLPVLALGGASNMLIADRGYPGLVIRYQGDEIEESHLGGSVRLRCGAGQLLSRLARGAARSGWAGLEWAEGIPGTLGGAIAGNAGAYGGEMADIVRFVSVVTPEGTLVERPADACGFRYRSSIFKREGLAAGFIVGAILELLPGDARTLVERMQEIGATRKRNSPLGSSCGSVFKNPPGEVAGRLIQEAGLLGAEEGPAQISTKHGNYIINRGNATADDVRRLIARARAAVKDARGIELELEVRLIGFDQEGS